MPSKKQRAKQRKAAKAAAPSSQPSANQVAQRKQEVANFIESNANCRSLTDYMCAQCGSWGTDTIVHKAPAQLHRTQIHLIAQNLQHYQGHINTKGVHPHKMRELARSPHSLPVCVPCMERKY